MTYPEIEQFINDYIKGTKPLPYEEYMAKIGYEYLAEIPSDDKRPALGLGALNINNIGEFVLIRVDRAKQFGIKKGDIVVKLLGKEMNSQTFENSSCTIIFTDL